MAKLKKIDCGASEGVNVVTIRDFQQKFYKHIKLARDFVVTIRGVEAFKVNFKRENVVTSKPEKVVTLKDVVTIKNSAAEYGCGCLRLPNKVMCDKHSRL